MKKRIIILIFVILFTTGCSCEYNLNIENDEYKEQIILKADNDDELNQFNINWKIPTDKEEYNIGEKVGSTPTYKSDIYDYNLTDNILTFSHTFNMNSIANSSAVSNCYDLLTVKRYETATIIATSTKLKCFDSYPEMDKITVTISVDKNVISNNADYVNGNKYTWYLNKSEKDKKSINMTIDNTIETKNETETNTQKKETIEENNTKTDYTFYIFCGILLFVMLTAYYIFNVIKKKNDEFDDL